MLARLPGRKSSGLSDRQILSGLLQYLSQAEFLLLHPSEVLHSPDEVAEVRALKRIIKTLKTPERVSAAKERLLEIKKAVRSREPATFRIDSDTDLLTRCIPPDEQPDIQEYSKQLAEAAINRE